MDNVIWLRGDPWRDLKEDLLAEGIYSILTENGTVRILNTAENWQKRIPAEHFLAHDNEEVRLFSINLATPCGFIISESIAHFQMTTNVLAVIHGDDVELLKHMYETIKSLPPFPLKGYHPETPCGAGFCELNKVDIRNN